MSLCVFVWCVSLFDLSGVAYLLEPLEGLGGELVLLGVLLEVGDQLGEDRLELLEGGGHVGGMAGQVDGCRCCCCCCSCYFAAGDGARSCLVVNWALSEWSGSPVEACEECNGGQCCSKVSQQR